MSIPRRVALTLATAASALALGAAKPAPAPTSFYPALSYRYGYSELRLANADGSQAVLLVRLAPAPGFNGSINQHAVAPLGQRQVAFVDVSGGIPAGLRIVSWSQPVAGGALSVVLDPTRFFTSPVGTALTSLDFSPDGATLASIEENSTTGATTLRFFDVATRSQIGDGYALSNRAPLVRWEGSGAVLLGGDTGVYRFANGVQTALFANARSWFDIFNQASAGGIFQNQVSGTNVLQRWDGSNVTDGSALLSTVTSGHHPSISCDNTRMIFQRKSPRPQTLVYNFSTGTEQAFSQDGSISYPAYPNGCG